MNMRERIARVLYNREAKNMEDAAIGMYLPSWKQCERKFLADADAVLAELRKPTLAMCLAASSFKFDPRSQAYATLIEESRDVWRAMIDAAKGEK